MAFKLHGSLNPHGGPVLYRGIIANTVTITELDAVVLDTDGFIALGTAGAALLGHVIGLSDKNGVGLNTTGVAGAAMGSFAGTFLTAAANETTGGQVRAEVDISQLTLYSATPDAALADTPGSDQAGVYFDLKNEYSIDETTVSDSAAQYHSWGVDPLTTTSVVVNIFKSSVFNTA